MKKKKEKFRAGRTILLLFALLGLFVPATAPADVGLYCGLPDDSRCELWTARRDRGAGDVTLASASSPSGDRVFTTGVDNSLGSSANNIVTLAFNGATGALLWERSYGGSGSDTPFSISVSPTGALVAVAGVAGESGETVADFVTLVYDATSGALEWATRYNSGGYEYVTDLVWSPDGSTVYITGYSHGSSPRAGDFDYLTMALDAETGSVEWITRNTVSEDGTDTPYAIAVSPDGYSVAVTGFLQKAGSLTWGFGTVVFDASTGTTRWLHIYDAGLNTGGTGWEVAFSPDSSRVHVAGQGQRQPGDGTRVPGVITYDTASGAVLWSERSIEFNAPDIPTMGVNPVDGTIYFATGALFPRGNIYEFDFLVIAYDGATGTRRWVKTYDHALQHQLLPAIAMPQGGQSLVIAGITQMQTNANNAITILSLDAATGTIRWDARWGAPLNPDTMNPSKPTISTAGGRAYVAKSVGKTHLNWDYLVVAYEI